MNENDNELITQTVNTEINLPYVTFSDGTRWDFPTIVKNGFPQLEYKIKLDAAKNGNKKSYAWIKNYLHSNLYHIEIVKEVIDLFPQLLNDDYSLLQHTHDEAVINYIITHPLFDVNKQSGRDKRTGLMYLIYENNSYRRIDLQNAAIYLLKHPELDLTIQDAHGDTAIDYLGKYASDSILEAFVDIFKDIKDAKNLFTTTSRAIAKKYWESGEPRSTLKQLQLLLKHGADPMQRDENGHDALHLIINQYLPPHQKEVIEFLKLTPINNSKFLIENRSLFLLAYNRSNYEIAMQLMDWGADIYWNITKLMNKVTLSFAEYLVENILEEERNNHYESYSWKIYEKIKEHNYVNVKQIVDVLLSERRSLIKKNGEINLAIVAPKSVPAHEKKLTFHSWLDYKKEIMDEFEERVNQGDEIALRKLFEMKSNKKCLFYVFMNSHKHGISLKEVTTAIKDPIKWFTDEKKERLPTDSAYRLDQLIETKCGKSNSDLANSMSVFLATTHNNEDTNDNGHELTEYTAELEI